MICTFDLQISDALQEIEQSESKPQESKPSPAPLPVALDEPEPVAAASATVQESTPPAVVPKPESPRIMPPIERKFSDAEIEARKEEAREIVMNAIDAALARDTNRLGALRPAPLPLTSDINELRKRAIAADQFDEEEEDEGPVASIPRTGLLAPPKEQTSTAHNLVMSLVVAAVIFILLKLMFYKSS